MQNTHEYKEEHELEFREQSLNNKSNHDYHIFRLCGPKHEYKRNINRNIQNKNLNTQKINNDYYRNTCLDYNEQNFSTHSHNVYLFHHRHITHPLCKTKNPLHWNKKIMMTRGTHI